MGTVQAKAFDFPDSFYARHLYPILDANCVVCHGEEKVKGGLRVDTYDRLMRGGKEGASHYSRQAREEHPVAAHHAACQTTRNLCRRKAGPP